MSVGLYCGYSDHLFPIGLCTMFTVEVVIFLNNNNNVDVRIYLVEKKNLKINGARKTSIVCEFSDNL